MVERAKALIPRAAREDVRILLIGGGVHPIPPTGYGAVERILTDFRVALVAAGHEAVIINPPDSLISGQAVRIVQTPSSGAPQ